MICPECGFERKPGDFVVSSTRKGSELIIRRVCVRCENQHLSGRLERAAARGFAAFQVRELYRHCQDIASIVRDLQALRAQGTEPLPAEELGVEVDEYYHVRADTPAERETDGDFATAIYDGVIRVLFPPPGAEIASKKEPEPEPTRFS